jgi:hypothetical protein
VRTADSISLDTLDAEAKVAICAIRDAMIVVLTVAVL